MDDAPTIYDVIAAIVVEMNDHYMVSDEGITGRDLKNKISKKLSDRIMKQALAFAASDELITSAGETLEGRAAMLSQSENELDIEIELTQKGLIIGLREGVGKEEGHDLFAERRNYQFKTGVWDEFGWNSALDNSNDLNIEADVGFSAEVERDEWRPLPIDRSHPSYAQVISGMKTIVEETRADNGYAANFPEERNEILENLETGIRDLEEQHSVTRHFIYSKIVIPLNRLSKIFAVASIGALAKKTVEFVLKLFSDL